MTGGPYCYVYDGNGLRVAKKSNASTCDQGTITTIYWRSITGDTLGETDSSGSTTNAAYNEYIFFAGRRIARRTGTGSVYYYFADHLGTTRRITDGLGNICYDAEFTPYGQEMIKTNTCPQNYGFTGYERDSETGLDYALARYYSSRLGRFLSPDPVGGSILDPQSINLYSYVRNSPTALVDPLGLDPRDVEPRFRDVVTPFPPGGPGLVCYINGFLSSCRTASYFLNVGLGAVCRFSDCSNIGLDDNGWFQWRVDRVSDYYAILCLGDHPDWTCRLLPAGREFIRFVNPTDIYFSSHEAYLRSLADEITERTGALTNWKTPAAWYGASLTIAALPRLWAAAAANVRIDGPSPGFAYGEGRAFAFRWGQFTIVRLDLHPMERGGSPIWHIHLFAPRGGEHGIRIPLHRP